MRLNELLQHAGHLSHVGQSLFRDDCRSHALETDVVEGIDLAAGDGFEHLRGFLTVHIAQVNVGSIVKEKLDNLEGKLRMHTYRKFGRLLS